MKKEQYEKPVIKTEDIKAETFCSAYQSPIPFNQPNFGLCCAG